MKLTSPIAIVLDTSPLGLLTQRPGHSEGDTCKSWAVKLDYFGCLFFVPEIADYELRRELLRHGNVQAIKRLDLFTASISGAYLSLATPDIRLAAMFWAQVRNQGKPTASPDALDGDALIAAQASLLDSTSFGLSDVVVATANVGHLSTLTNAVLWSDIEL